VVMAVMAMFIVCVCMRWMCGLCKIVRDSACWILDSFHTLYLTRMSNSADLGS
jgi:hypothetical protein